MKGMARHSQMAKIRSPGKHHRWKNGHPDQRAATGSGNHLCDSKPEGPPEANSDPLGVLVNSDSGKLNRKTVCFKCIDSDAEVCSSHPCLWKV